MRDDFDSVVADRFKMLDDVPVPDTWSRVLDHGLVLNTWSPARNAEEVVTTVDLETSIPTEPRKLPVRVLAAILAAAAIVVATVLVVTHDHNATPADQPSPTVTVAPTTPPRPLSNPAPHERQPLEPGTYYLDMVDGIPTPRIFLTIGTGWWDRTGLVKNDFDRELTSEEFQQLGDEFLRHQIGGIGFSHPDAVYSDACHWEDGYHPGPVDTVDGLVSALTEQRGWADVTAPSDISIDGYVGKAFQRTAPADMSDCSTRVYGSRTTPGVRSNPDFRSWEIDDDFNAQYEPGMIETLWVLDLDGTMVVITTGAFPKPSAGADADFAADVLDSIRIDRP